MKLGIRAKLFILSFTVIALSIGAAYLFIRSQLDGLLTRQIADDLTVRAELLRNEAESAHFDLNDRIHWDELADEFGLHAKIRATVIRQDGAVIGDSEVPTDNLPAIENHAKRPEFMAVMAQGHGVSSRLSATVDRRMLYVAVPFEREGRAVGVVRVAIGLEYLDSAIGKLGGVVTVAMLIALAVAAFLSTAASELVSKTARELTAAARKMAAGDFSMSPPTRGSDEFGTLGKAMDTLARNLSQSLSDLRTERDRMGGILAGMQEGVLLLDGENRVAIVNPALREMLLMHGDTQGRPAQEAIENVDVRELLENARASRDAVAHEIAIEGLKPRRLLVRAAHLGGEEDAVFAVCVDVTEMRKLETLRKDFVANVSHELRTPVTAIRSAAETLGSVLEANPDAGQTFVDIIDRNATRLSGLVEDLLDLSRIESRELKLNMEPIDASQCFAQIMGLFQERAQRRGVKLVSVVAPNTSKFIADSKALENVLANLVDNAVKYAGSGAETRLVARDHGEAVRISVEDTGPGIEPRHLPRLFERFYRVDTGRSRELGGTGLGLSIVKHLVESMGGQISVQSEPGKGTLFSFSLRKAGLATPAANEAGTEQPPRAPDLPSR